MRIKKTTRASVLFSSKIRTRTANVPENRRLIIVIYLALVIVCSRGLRTVDIVISHLEMLAILVERGGNANILNYRNY